LQETVPAIPPKASSLESLRAKPKGARMPVRAQFARSPATIIGAMKPMRLPRAPNMSAGRERGRRAGVTAPAPGVRWITARTIAADRSFWNRRRIPTAIVQGRLVDAQAGAETSKAFVHMPLTSPALSAG
jgi:hypothetical protein